MGKRFYIVLFSALCISLLLLGFSFSKESGSNDVSNMSEIKNDNYRVVYSNNPRLDTNDNNEVDISIINKSNKKLSFSLYLKEINEKKYTDVYYALNDEESLVMNGVIKLGELNSFGETGDYDHYHIRIYSKSDSNLEFKLEVKEVDPNLLSNKIIAAKGVYQDTDGNFRYFGETANNFIKYNDETLRIVGLIDNHVIMIGEATMLNSYSPLNNNNNNYLTTENYLKSFSSNSEVTLSNIANKRSWLLDGKEYWLLDSEGANANCTSLDSGIESVSKMSNYYIRNVYEIDDVLVTKGDGTLAHPYEVSYES